MPRNPTQKCSQSWEDRYGTTISGNLAPYKVGECIEATVSLSGVHTVFPWVVWGDFGYYHIRCPYSTEAGINFVLDTNPSSSTYWSTIDVSNESSVHPTTSGIMVKHSRGSRHGWLCVDPTCPYYQGTVSGSNGGRPYFHI